MNIDTPEAYTGNRGVRLFYEQGIPGNALCCLSLAFMCKSMVLWSEDLLLIVFSLGLCSWVYGFYVPAEVMATGFLWVVLQ